MIDPDDSDFIAYAERALSDLVPKIKMSAITASLVPRDETDIKFALELGLSIMFDKPILLLIEPGTVIPEHLARVADGFVEFDLHNPDKAMPGVVEFCKKFAPQADDE